MINIVLSSDNNYAKELYTAINSVLDTCKSPQNCCFYIIDNGIDSRFLRHIRDLSKRYSAKVCFVDFTDEIQALELDDSFPASGFARLFIGEIQEIDRAIYMDCDMITVSDITSLWNENLDDCVLGAVQDSVNLFYRKQIGLADDDRYINSGLLLINVDLWRKKKYEDKCVKYINNSRGRIPHNDQGVINAVCKDDIKILPCKYNLQNPMLIFTASQIKAISKTTIYYTDEEINKGVHEPCIIHYTEEFFNRPWRVDCTHPFRENFLRYQERTPFEFDLENISLSRNAAIMRWVQLHMPFIAYVIMMNMITIKKRMEYRGKDEK